MLELTKKTVTKTLKLRIYPTKEQEEIINQNIGCSRFIYNFCRAKQKMYEDLWIKVYNLSQSGQIPSDFEFNTPCFNKFECMSWRRELKEHYPWLKKADKFAIETAIEDLDLAYKKYYSKKGGKPKFRSKKEHEQSYRTKCNRTKSTKKDGSVSVSETIRIENNKLRLPKAGLVKFKDKSKPNGKIKTVTVKRSKSNKYFACVVFECEILENVKTNKKVGIDVGIKKFCTLSDKTVIDNPKFYQKEEEKLAGLQQILSRKTSGSNNWWKAKNRVAKLHEKITNRRNDYLNKLTAWLVNEYDIIFIEDLDVQNMKKKSKGTPLAKLLHDTPFYTFKQMLKSKAEWYGKRVIEVGRYFASSQICSNCHYKNKEVKDLNVRDWTCPKCNSKHERDYNASLNILNEGIRILNGNR